MHRTLLAGALTATAAAAALTGAASAASPAPDPAAFTPRHYTFCGWWDFDSGSWSVVWQDRFASAGGFQVLYARDETCQAARRNFARNRRRGLSWRYGGYRCVAVMASGQWSDYRCAKTRRGRRVAFRWQTGSAYVGALSYITAPRPPSS